MTFTSLKSIVRCNKIFYAPNIRGGGGKTLLASLLKQDDTSILWIIDKSFKHERLPERVIFINNNFERIILELLFAILLKREQKLLSFSSIGPLFCTRAAVIIFFQNTLILKPNKDQKFLLNLKAKLKNKLFYLTKSKKNYYICQTAEVEKLLTSSGVRCDKVFIFPFYDRGLQKKTKIEYQKCSSDGMRFIYATSKHSHKNFSRLLDAMIILEKEYSRKILLFITIQKTDVEERDCMFYNDILKSKNIIFTGQLNQHDLVDYYGHSQVLAYPSLEESFGLPLLEAISHNLSVVSSNLPYVHSLIRPTAVFDPLCAQNIAFSINNLLKAVDLNGEIPIASLKGNIKSAKEFLEMAYAIEV